MQISILTAVPARWRPALSGTFSLSIPERKGQEDLSVIFFALLPRQKKQTEIVPKVSCWNQRWLLQLWCKKPPEISKEATMFFLQAAMTPLLLLCFCDDFLGSRSVCLGKLLQDEISLDLNWSVRQMWQSIRLPDLKALGGKQARKTAWNQIGVGGFTVNWSLLFWSKPVWPQMDDFWGGRKYEKQKCKNKTNSMNLSQSSLFWRLVLLPFTAIAGIITGSKRNYSSFLASWGFVSFRQSVGVQNHLIMWFA